MNYFLLIASDTDKSRLSMPSAHQVALYRLEREEWAIGKRTKNRTNFSPGDKVLIYLSGKRQHGMHFIASATIETESYPVRYGMRSQLDAPGDTGHIMGEYAIRVSGVTIFRSMVNIAGIRDRLSFIKKPESKKWGAYLQGGSARISRKDYELIIRLGEGDK